MQENGQKTSPLGWVVPLVALLLGLGIVCMIGAALAAVLGADGSYTGGVPLATPAFVPADDPRITPTESGAAMQASSEQMLEAYGGIPLPAGVRSQQAVGSEQVFSVIVQQPFERVVAFYQAAMPELEWVPIDSETASVSQSAVLLYEKDGRTASLAITRMPFVGTIVAVTLSQE